MTQISGWAHKSNAMLEKEYIPVVCVPSATVAICPGGVCPGWCLLGDVCPGGCLPGGLSAWVCLPGGSTQGGVSLACLLRGVYTSLLWTKFLTHACENITFPQLRLRLVKIQCSNADAMKCAHSLHVTSYFLWFTWERNKEHVLHLFHWLQQSDLYTGTCSVYLVHHKATGWIISTIHYLPFKTEILFFCWSATSITSRLGTYSKHPGLKTLSIFNLHTMFLSSQDTTWSPFSLLNSSTRWGSGT